MKKILIVLSALALLAGHAEAARLGGGKSLGMSRPQTMQKQQAAPAPGTPPQTAAAPAPHPATATPPAPPAPQPSGMSRWLGPIAGIAAGIGLAALASHFGFGEGLANVMMIMLLVVAAVFLFRMFFRRQAEPTPQMAGAGAPMQFEAPAAAPAASAAAPAPLAASNIPADFDTAGFLRQAKLNFNRLQAANDAGNMDDIKQFTAPEVFAEIQMQYEERGRAKQQTDVVQLNAELVDLESDASRHVASVRFWGQLREEANGPIAPFDEVWHLTKPLSGAEGWRVAGIEQLQ